MKDMFTKFGAWLSTLPMLLLPAAAMAQLSQSSTYLGDVQSGIGSDANKALPTLIGDIIAVLLSVLGIIFVLMIVYAGFLYLTSQGESGPVDKAKKILTQSTIGLVLIIAAYAIASFVLDALTGAATGS